MRWGQGGGVHRQGGMVGGGIVLVGYAPYVCFSFAATGSHNGSFLDPAGPTGMTGSSLEPLGSD